MDTKTGGICRRCERALTLGVAALAGYVACAWFPTPAKLLSEHGQGYQLAGAAEILAGRHPFIDFSDIVYGPLMYYVSALAQGVTGGRVGGELALAVGAFALGYALFFRLLRACAVPAGIAVTATVIAILVQPAAYRYYHLLLPVLVFTAVWRYGAAPGRLRLVVMGMAVTVTGLYRSDLGVITFGAGVVTILVGDADRRTKGTRSLAFAGAVLGCALPWLGWLAMNGKLAGYLANASLDALAAGEGLFRPAPRLDFAHGFLNAENAKAVLFRLPLLMVGFAGATLLAYWGQLAGAMRARLSGVLAFAVLTQFSGLVIFDWIHVRDTLPMRIFLLAWIAGVAVNSAGDGSAVAKARRVLLLGTVGMIGVGLVIGALAKETPRELAPSAVMGKVQAYAAGRAEFLAEVRAAGVNFRAELYEYLRDHSAPDEAVFAVIEAPQANYFADRRLPGAQLAIFPGYFSSPEDQRRLIAEIRRGRTAFVVLDHLAQPEYPDFSLPTFAPEFWSFLETEFVEVVQIGYCRVLTPRNRAAMTP